MKLLLKKIILYLQIIIKCEHFMIKSHLFMYRHMEKLTLFKIYTTCNYQYCVVFSTDFLTQGAKYTQNLPIILGLGEHFFTKSWDLMS